MHEYSMHDEAVFITLTYDDAHLDFVGDLRLRRDVATLSVSTCQLFLKRLRARLAPVKVRFFLCGEYGENFGRPHYHLILFGYSFPDKVRLESSGKFEEFTSDELADIWGKGRVHLGSVTFDSAAYVANYATKKIIGKDALAHYGARRPEFLLMSRNPGIGSSWISKFSGDVFPSDEVVVKGFPSRPPRFYDQFIEGRDPDLWARIKAKRLVASEKLEEMVWKGGRSLFVAPSRNGRRLIVRSAVASAKLKLKSRNMERSS